MELFKLGIDLGKTTFSSGRDEPTRRGTVAEATLSGAALALYRESEGGVIGIEACGGSHFLGRACREQGQLSGAVLVLIAELKQELEQLAEC